MPAITRRCIPALIVVLTLIYGALSMGRASAQTATTDAWKTVEEHWYIMEIGGSKVGWSSAVTESNGDQIRSSTLTSLKIERGDIVVAISTDSKFLETKDGKPVTMEYTQNTGTQTMHTVWEFKGDTIKQTSTQGGRETTKDVPSPKGEWMTPAAADRYSDKMVADKAEEFTVHTINPETGLSPTATTNKRVGEDTLEVNGRKVPVTIWKVTNDMMKGTEITDKLNEAGDLVYQETPSGLGKIVMRMATKEQAKSDAPKGAGAGPDIMAKSFVKPDKPIANSMKTVKARLKLTMKEGNVPELPSAGAQHVEKGEDSKSVVLVIDIDDNLPASDADKNDKKYLADSAMVDINDPMVQTLSKKGAKGAGDDLMARAEALRKLVNKHISKKGMATAFASASETARTRTGDCSEHGVLLCALLRANGIPARVASGLVYAEQFMGEAGIFGWHMWAQALIDGKWVDFDATLPVRYNATHILTATSDLSESFGGSDLASMLQLIGNIDIQVLDVKYNARDSAGDSVHE